MLEVTLSSQLYTFLYSIVCGAAAGVVYTILSFIRTVFKNKRSITFLCDVAFMLIFAVITYIFSVGFTQGFVRVYVLAGEIIGFVVFKLTLGSLSQRLFRYIFSIFSKISAIIQKNISVFAKKVLKQSHKMLYNKDKKKENLQNDGKEG